MGTVTAIMTTSHPKIARGLRILRRSRCATALLFLCAGLVCETHAQLPPRPTEREAGRHTTVEAQAGAAQEDGRDTTLRAQTGAQTGTQTDAPTDGGRGIEVIYSLFPALFYSPDTGLGGGAGGSITWRDTVAAPTGRPNSVSGVVFYTSKNQTLTALQPRLYLGSRWLVQFDLAYRKFPFVTYGLGNDTPEDAEEDYVTEAFETLPAILYRLTPELSLGATYHLRKLAVLEYEDGGFVAANMRDANGPDRGWTSGLGPVLEWDRRDNLFSAERGQYLRLSHRLYRDALGSDADYEEYEVDARQFFPLGNGHVLAFQAVGTRRTGRLFFTDYASLSDVQRGAPVGRYQDRMLAMAQAEWRLPISRRFSAAFFAAGGQVAGEWEGFGLAETKVTGGAGLRYILSVEERTRLRVDFGLGDAGMEVYFQFGEAF